MATVQSDIFKPTKYGGKYTATLIPGTPFPHSTVGKEAHYPCPGDGIGAEVAESVKTVFKADNVPIEWEQIDVTGVESGDKHSEDLFRESIASLKRNKLGLKGVDSVPVLSKSPLNERRNPTYSGGEIRSPVLQCCPSSRTRYLRIHCSNQEYPWLQDSA